MFISLLISSAVVNIRSQDIHIRWVDLLPDFVAFEISMVLAGQYPLLVQIIELQSNSLNVTDAVFEIRYVTATHSIKENKSDSASDLARYI